MARRNRWVRCVFLGALLAGLLVASFVFVVAVDRVGRDCVVSESWFPDVLKIKRLFAERTPSPRIIVSAGSGSLFGVDSAVLSKALEMPVINMALHAGLPLEYYCEELRRMVRPGDIVVMPLELGHFYEQDLAEEAVRDFPLSVLLGIAPEYRRALSPTMLATIYARYGLSWMRRNLRGKTFWAPRPVEALEFIWRKERNDPDYGGYSFHALSEHGDMLVSRTARMLEETKWVVTDRLTASFLKAWRRFVSDMADAGVRVILTWPNLRWYPDRDGFEALRKTLADEGIPLLGRPEAFSFPDACYFDTQYHLTARGAALNARELAKVVGPAIGREPHFPDDAPMHVVFAESVRASFPEADRTTVYASGVRVSAGTTRLRISVPRVYVGKGMAADFLVRDTETNTIVSVSCRGETLPLRIVPHAFCREVIVRMPCHLTQGATVDLDVNVSNPVGFERMTLLDSILMESP